VPRQRLAVLGSTGSIGANTLEVAALHPDRFDVVALAAATRVDALLAQCVRWRPRIAVMADATHALALARKVKAAGLPTRVESGARAVEQLAGSAEVDTVMAAIVGAAGLAPCLAAARAGKRLLLANKEALVVGGPLFLDAVKAGGATLLPIDSEHSAIFQALPADRGTWKVRVDRLILTASGGPFRARAPETLRDATPAQACAHPNWVMGRKISVDSATMMNKALEVIEAHHLFGIDAERIEVVIHPQSVIHSMVQYRDGSVIAQLGTPDMKMPISYGLGWPDRIESGARAPDFATFGALTFEAADSPAHRARYPSLALAWEALAAPPGSCAILNAANEVAVAAFLDNHIRFDQIYAVNRDTLDSFQPRAPHDLAELLELDVRARSHARQTVRALAAIA
jgi:1-deoxy-D-xylulose-5-phosphate reductoisomerase